MPDQARRTKTDQGGRTVIRPDWRAELLRERPSVLRQARGHWARTRRSIDRIVAGADRRRDPGQDRPVRGTREWPLPPRAVCPMIRTLGRSGFARRDWRADMRGRWLRGRIWAIEHRVLVAGVALVALLAAADTSAPHPVDVSPEPGVAQHIPVAYPLQVQADQETSKRDLAAIDNGERLRESEVVATATRSTLDRAKAEAAAAVAGAPSPWLDGTVTATPGGIEAGIGGYALPARGVFTSGYGSRWGTFHYGIDIAAPIGSPIYAVADGTVIDAGPAQGFGLWVRIRHLDGTVSVYGHMYDFTVWVGDHVRAGQQIARIGNRGDSTGPHLHFEILVNGQHVDPQPWLALHGIEVG